MVIEPDSKRSDSKRSRRFTSEIPAMRTVVIRQLLGSDAAVWSAIRLESLVNDPFAFSSSVAEHMTLDVEAIRKRFSHPADGGINLGAFKDQELVGTLIFMRVQGQKQRHKGRISA